MINDFLSSYVGALKRLAFPFKSHVYRFHFNAVHEKPLKYTIKLIMVRFVYFSMVIDHYP